MIFYLEMSIMVSLLYIVLTNFARHSINVATSRVILL